MRKIVFKSVLLIVLVGLFGFVSTVSIAAEKAVAGSLTVNEKKVQLLYAYVDMVQPAEPIIVLSSKPLPKEAIPFVPAKMVQEQQLYVIAFTISSKDKKLVDGYGMLQYPGNDTGVGFGRVEDKRLAITINKLDDNLIEGKISTVKPVKLSQTSYSFDLVFKVKKK